MKRVCIVILVCLASLLAQSDKPVFKFGTEFRRRELQPSECVTSFDVIRFLKLSYDRMTEASLWNQDRYLSLLYRTNKQLKEADMYAAYAKETEAYMEKAQGVLDTFARNTLQRCNSCNVQIQENGTFQCFVYEYVQ